jgi:adenosylcobyric acid synthase
MLAKTLMIQGTASSVGKSLITAALCRYFYRRGIKVAPFKAQNMALNSFVTADGLEIGRAQAAQAEACGIAPEVDMNPVLLKCESDQRVQVIVRGKVVESMTGEAYYGYAARLRPVIAESLERLRSRFELVILEGAGSPAEVNLQSRDLANGFAAQLADAPVLLVGDIDRGGVFASLWGTLDLMTAEDRARVKGLLINKFRGNLDILKPGLDFLEQKTKLPVLGVLPYLSQVALAQEDSTALEDTRRSSSTAVLRIAVIRFPHISNFDDFQPLEREPAVDLFYAQGPDELSAVDLVILPGTKTTVADLEWLREKGFEPALQARVKKDQPILGICGGYQMLGKKIEDPDHAETKQSSVPGLGFLPVTTYFEKEKQAAQVEAVASGHGLFEGRSLKTPLRAYEIHMGRVKTDGPLKPLFHLRVRNQKADEGNEGAVLGNVMGTILHGLFENEEVRSALLIFLAKRKNVSVSAGSFSKEADYDRLAEMIETHVDAVGLNRMVGLEGVLK